MHSDRETSAGDGPPPPPEAPAAAHEYGYGDDDAVLAGPYTASEPVDAPGGPPHHDAATPGDPAATEARSVTGVQGVRAPRAMLRPVPEGFPPPPPQPEAPNRRPPRSPAPEGGTRPRRGLLAAAVLVLAALLLAAVIVGGVLAVRALGTGGAEDASPAGASDTPQDPAAGGTARIGELTVSARSTELGVRSVGPRNDPQEPEGEFVIVTVEIANEGTRPERLSEDTVSLVSADGESHQLDRAASRAHIARTDPPGLLPGESTERMHLVYDVPLGTEVESLRFDLPGAGEGDLPLGT